MIRLRPFFDSASRPPSAALCPPRNRQPAPATTAQDPAGAQHAPAPTISRPPSDQHFACTPAKRLLQSCRRLLATAKSRSPRNSTGNVKSNPRSNHFTSSHRHLPLRTPDLATHPNHPRKTVIPTGARRRLFFSFAPACPEPAKGEAVASRSGGTSLRSLAQATEEMNHAHCLTNSIQRIISKLRTHLPAEVRVNHFPQIAPRPTLLFSHSLPQPRNPTTTPPQKNSAPSPFPRPAAPKFNNNSTAP